MSKKVVNFHTDAETNQYEMVFMVASVSEPASLDQRLFSAGGVAIFTGPGETGTELTAGTDYDFFIPNQFATQRLGMTIYTEIRVLNAAYFNIPLYIPAESMNFYGDIIDDGDINENIDSNEIGRRLDLSNGKRRGLLCPLYIYPSNIYTNDTFNSIIEIKKLFPDIPMIAIINPSSGPGTVQDGNYLVAMKRLHGAGIIVVGYVATTYAARDQAAVKADVLYWRTLYPGIDGIFFDEMTYDADPDNIEYYRNIGQFCRDNDHLIIGNAGSPFDHGYFDEDTSDIIVGWESSSFPSVAQAKENYADGMYSYSKIRRAMLVHSQTEFDYSEVNRVITDYGWIWITHSAAWSDFSEYFIKMLTTLSNYHSIGNDSESAIQGSVSIEPPFISISIDDSSSWTVPKGKYNVYGLSSTVVFKETINSIVYSHYNDGAIFSDGVNCIIENTSGSAATVVLREY